MKKSNFVLLIMLIVMVVSVFCSCSQTGNGVSSEYSMKDSMLFRAKAFYLKDNIHESYVGATLQLITVPLGYKEGDTILLNDKCFILESVVQRIKVK